MGDIMSDYPDKYCDDHPFQKMTLLLNTYVCDICDPPLNLYPERAPKPRETAPEVKRTFHPFNCMCAVCKAYYP